MLGTTTTWPIYVGLPVKFKEITSTALVTSSRYKSVKSSKGYREISAWGGLNAIPITSRCYVVRWRDTQSPTLRGTGHALNGNILMAATSRTSEMYQYNMWLITQIKMAPNRSGIIAKLLPPHVYHLDLFIPHLPQWWKVLISQTWTTDVIAKGRAIISAWRRNIRWRRMQSTRLRRPKRELNTLKGPIV